MEMRIEDAFRSWDDLTPDQRDLVLDTIDLATALFIQNAPRDPWQGLTDPTLEVERALLSQPVPFHPVNDLLRRHLTAAEIDRAATLRQILVLLDK